MCIGSKGSDRAKAHALRQGGRSHAPLATGAHSCTPTANKRRHTMKRLALITVATAALAGCATGGSGGWTTLIDGGKGMDNFNVVGEADWAAVDGAIQATQGGKTPSYLVTKNSYKDFVIRVEFWASDNANSGVFLRCQNPGTITDENCYEANIFDQRPDPTY